MRRLWVLSVLLVSCYTPGNMPPLGYETGDDLCGNGVDDDHDGQIDCADKDCLYTSGLCGERIPLVPAQHALHENTPELCHDFIDNDNDGNFDCNDKECQGVAEACCSNENSDEQNRHQGSGDVGG